MRVLERGGFVFVGLEVIAVLFSFKEVIGRFFFLFLTVLGRLI